MYIYTHPYHTHIHKPKKCTPKPWAKLGVPTRAVIQTLLHNSLKEVTCFGIRHSHIRNRTIEEVVGWNNCPCVCLSKSADCNKIVTKCSPCWSRLQGKLLCCIGKKTVLGMSQARRSHSLLLVLFSGVQNCLCYEAAGPSGLDFCMSSCF